MCALFKFSAGLITEGMSIVMIMAADDIGDVVKDFIAFNIIKEIDNMMVMTVSNCDIEEEFDKALIMYPESQNFITSLELIRNLKNDEKNIKLVRSYFIIMVNTICDFIYTVMYFYFCPFIFFLILIIVFTLQEIKTM